MPRPTTIRVGDVVEAGPASAALRGVVHSRCGGGLALLPIVSDGGLSHRSDVPVTELSDMAAIGFAGLDLVIRPSKATLCSLGNGDISDGSPKRIGRLSAALLASVAVAVQRECAASASEAKWRSARR